MHSSKATLVSSERRRARGSCTKNRDGDDNSSQDFNHFPIASTKSKPENQFVVRLWTLHPRYLDAQGLVALWREALLAQKVLQGATKGYRHHPQLARFRACSHPKEAIASYLAEVLEEAVRRGYAFDATKIASIRFSGFLNETEGQLLYEWQHLLNKLKRRDRARYAASLSTTIPSQHPLFRIVPGNVQDWERVM
jgi:hypothetical protein